MITNYISFNLISDGGKKFKLKSKFIFDKYITVVDV